MTPTKSNAVPMSSDQMMSKTESIGKLLRRNVVSAKGGREDNDVRRQDRAWDAFQQTLKDSDKAMKNASKDLKELMREVVEENIKLRKDEKADFERTFKEMQAALATLYEKGGDPESVKHLENMIMTTMQHTEKAKPKGGALSQEVDHRITKFFSASKDDLDSPLFRKLAGLDKKDPSNMINAVDQAKNMGIAERLKRELGDGIMGPEDEKAASAAKVAETMGGKGGAFPSKIENLSVNNLIVKSVVLDRGQEKDITPKQEMLGYKGKTAVPLLEHQEHEEAKVEPKQKLLPYEKTEKPLQIAHDPNSVSDVDFKEVQHTKPEPKQIEHKAPLLLSYDPKKDPEPPVKVKPMNPHAKLKTQQTPIAMAVAGALGAAATPALAQKPTIVDSFKPTNDLLDNDVGVRAADATKYTEKDVEPKEEEGSGIETAAGLLSSAADMFGGGRGRKGKGVKPKTGLLKKVGKAAKGGLLGLGAGLALDYAADKLDESGHDQLAIGAKVGSQAAEYAGIGATVGSFIPGVGTLVGGALGGVAGAAKGVYDNWDKIEKPEWLGGKPKGKIDTKVNTSGQQLSAMQQQQQQAMQQPSNVTVNQHSTPVVNNSQNFVPINGTPRARESYFDRQMMGTFVK